MKKAEFRQQQSYRVSLRGMKDVSRLNTYGSTLPVCYRKSSDKFYLGYTEVPKKGEEKNLLSDDAYLRNEGGSK